MYQRRSTLDKAEQELPFFLTPSVPLCDMNKREGRSYKKIIIIILT